MKINKLEDVRRSSIQRVSGNTLGLKPSQNKRIERIYRRRIPHTRILTPELARYLAELSSEIGRQIGILVDRRGYVIQVIVGDVKQIMIPRRKRFRSAAERLCGLRYIHTHLQGEPLSEEDLADLSLLRFDLIAAIHVGSDGLAQRILMATLEPGPSPNKPWQIWEPLPPTDLYDLEFNEMIRELERELSRTTPLSTKLAPESGQEKALLVGVAMGNTTQAENSMAELQSLARSCDISILDSIIQKRPSIHPQYVVGKGKLQDLVIQTLQSGAGMIVFDHDLTPGQMRSITDFTELKIIDRTQLILDIFSQRARTREGRIQVELAQLSYRLPRLLHRDAGLSRLAGGIGGRGPGETKLEIDRRRVRERIHRLEKEIETVRKGRRVRKSRRTRNGLPLVCIVGYTNAGKSTLFNALTKSHVYAEDRLFATLDPSTRRLSFPGKRTTLLTDTVGFIRDLPPDLIAAFRATLEELNDADLLIHVIDSSSEHCEKQCAVVDSLLESLQLQGIPRLNVLNKSDKAYPVELEHLCRRYHGIPTCALTPASLLPLKQRLATLLFPHQGSVRASKHEEALPA